MNALAAANRVLVPVQAEYYALEGLSQLVHSLGLIRNRLNPELALSGVLLTMVDGRTRLSADVSAELERHFGTLLFRARVPRSVRIAEAPSHGRADHHLRPALCRARRPTGRWRWNLSTVPERRGLGRGLEVLIGGAGPTDLAHVPVDQIHPNPRQPRKRFDHEATAGLAESIRAQGIIQPVVLRPRAAGGYELIAGERRWRAAREANLETLPALVRDAADRDALLLGLVENVAREELSPVEEARAYALLVDEFELSLGEIAERVGGSKPAVSNRVRLLELSDDILSMVERGELTEGHARAVLAVPGQRGPAPAGPQDRPPGAVGAGGGARGALVRREGEAQAPGPGRSRARGTRSASRGAADRVSARGSAPAGSRSRSRARSSSRSSPRRSSGRCPYPTETPPR